MAVVYVSGPYTGAVDTNVANAMRAAHALMDAGHSPICPHLMVLMQLQRARPYADWMRVDLDLVYVCDAVVRLPGHSPGADRECAYAEDHGIPVYRGVEEFVHAQLEYDNLMEATANDTAATALEDDTDVPECDR